MHYSITEIPPLVKILETKCKEVGFTMPSDRLIGSLLRTLCLSKPGGLFLELGTGIGLSTAWIAEGLTQNSKVTSIDNDPKLIQIVEEFYGNRSDIELVCEDGSKWLQNYSGPKFDLIFADAWPGKYSDLEITLNLLAEGGFYVIDDMNPQTNWPEDHEEKASDLVHKLSDRSDLSLTKFDWSTGVIVGVKK